MVDVIIILGHESKSDELSDIAKERIAKAIDIYKENRAKIIMSGGHSLKSRIDSGPAESELMKDYAIKKGITSIDILVEDKSRDTQGNAYFTKQIIKSKSWKNILVVTSDFHILKTKFFFDYIYGKDYNISYSGVKTELSEEELREMKKKEKESVNVMKEIYKDKKIKKGEDEKVGEVLNEFYSKFE